jgi:hypothetical protein
MHCLAFLALCAFALPLNAQEPASPPTDPTVSQFKPLEFNRSAQVRIDVLMLAAPEEKILPLLPQLRDATKIAAAEAALLEMIAHRQAQLLDWPEVTVHPGQRGVSETVVEEKYPIEFEQPQLPTSKPADKAPVPELSTSEKALQILRQAGLVVPSTFETRNTGSTLEATAAIAADAKAVTLQIAPRCVFLAREREFPAGRTEKGEVFTVKQPIFRTASVTLETTLTNGERRLLYFGKPSLPGGEIILFIAGVKILPPVGGQPR